MIFRRLRQLHEGLTALRLEAATQSRETATIKRMLQTIDDKLTQLGAKLMASLQDIQDAVAQETTVEQSAITLLQQLSAQLQAALNSGDTTQAQAILDQINANTQALANAVTANTPAAPTT